jgi:hypothetical protein
MANYNDWYENNNRNPFIMLFDGIFDNLILLPQRQSRFLGWVRFFGFMSLMWFDPFGLNLQDTFWIIPYALVCIVEMGIGIIQAWGYHWGNKEVDGVEYTYDVTPARASVSGSSPDEYQYIRRWFATRDYYLSGMNSTEQAKFFVDTGAITEESIQEMSKYPNTKRALQRLDFELSNRTPKEQIEFLRGYRS